jgi:oxygen-independent coproporphyrinogen-3 oxidase
MPTGGEEFLSDVERRLERLLLGLRVSDGVPEAWLNPIEADRFVSAGLARRADGRVSLTDRGLLVANDLVLSLDG